MNSAIQQLTAQVRAGSLPALARVLTEVENRGPACDAVLSGLFPCAKKSLRIGITGAPGSGKSTLTDQIARELRKAGHTVAIIAVDPTSPFSGGAILGDRVRMQSHHADPGVFIRSMATRGALGGLAPAVGDAITVLEAAGRDVVIIETVGVGQAEVDVVGLADVVLLVLTPSMGDDVQAAKAGIMEVADIFAINKADQPEVERLEQQIEAMLSLLPADQAKPPLARTVATTGEGVAELTGQLLRLADTPTKTAAEAYWRQRLLDRFAERLLRDFRAKLPEGIEISAEKVVSGYLNPYEFIEEALLDTGAGGAGHATIDHIGVAVRSIDSALEFYRDALGIEPLHRTVVEHERVEVAMLPFGQPRIELLEPTVDDSVIARFLSKRGEGVHHIAIRVDDLEAAVTAVKASGRRLVTDEIQVGAEDYRYVFMHPKSTGGILLELIEPIG